MFKVNYNRCLTQSKIGTCTRKHMAAIVAAQTPNMRQGKMHSEKCHVCGNGYEVCQQFESIFNSRMHTVTAFTIKTSRN